MPITSSEDPKFKVYAKHVLDWEGPMGDDPRDNASKCTAGLSPIFKRGRAGKPIHTVKGVTWCTFKSIGPRLGVLPTTHKRFVEMTEDDARKFIFYTYSNYPWSKLPDPVAIAMTETAWGSGPGRPYPTAVDTLKALGVATLPQKGLKFTAADKQQIIADIKKVNANVFFNKYNEIRKNWLTALGNTAYGAPYKRGWLNRQNAFIKLGDQFVTSASPFFFYLF